MRCSAPQCRRRAEVAVHTGVVTAMACAADGVRLVRLLGRDVAELVPVRAQGTVELADRDGA